jgi:hypothetical protein
MASSVSGAQTTTTVTLALASGATLRNELNGLSASFTGGDVGLQSVTTAAQPLPLRTRVSYNNLRFVVAGVNYLANGFYELSFSASGGFNGGSGEVLLSSGGTPVGRIYANASGLFIEVNGTVQPFGAGAGRLPRATAR